MVGCWIDKWFDGGGNWLRMDELLTSDDSMHR